MIDIELRKRSSTQTKKLNQRMSMMKRQINICVVTVNDGSKEKTTFVDIKQVVQ